MAFLLSCSAFFSGTETALFSLTREQVKHLRSHGHHVDRLLTILSDNPAGLLVAILFGNLVVNILFFSTSAVLALEIGNEYGEWGQAVVGFSVLLVVILAGEILPKAIGISFPERLVRMNSLLLRGWFHFLGPIRVVLEIITKKMEPADHHDNRMNPDELKMLIDATHHDATTYHDASTYHDGDTRLWSNNPDAEPVAREWRSCAAQFNRCSQQWSRYCW